MSSQFMINEFSMSYHLDTNAHGDGILVYFRNNNSAKLFNFGNLPSDMEFILSK